MRSWPLSAFSLLLVLGAAGPSSAADQPSSPAGTPGLEASAWRIAASAVRLSGHTTYELRALSPDPRDPDQLVPIRSELEFPLDATLLGLTARWTPGRAGTSRWSLAAEFAAAVDDPSDPMTDGDWIDERQIGYSESPARLDLLQGALELAYAPRPGPQPALQLLLRLDYQHVEQSLVGYEGWRRSLFSDEVLPFAGTAAVVDYRVDWLSPRLGGRVARDLGAHARASLEGMAGMSLAWDEDDHLLRGRRSEGDGVGFAASGHLAIDLQPGFAPWRWLTVGLVGGLSYLHAEGDVTQTWYRDEDLPAGTVIADIPYTLESLQYEVGLRLGAAF